MVREPHFAFSQGPEHTHRRRHFRPLAPSWSRSSPPFGNLPASPVPRNLRFPLHAAGRMLKAPVQLPGAARKAQQCAGFGGMPVAMPSRCGGAAAATGLLQHASWGAVHGEGLVCGVTKRAGGVMRLCGTLPCAPCRASPLASSSLVPVGQQPLLRRGEWGCCVGLSPLHVLDLREPPLSRSPLTRPPPSCSHMVCRSRRACLPRQEGRGAAQGRGAGAGKCPVPPAIVARPHERTWQAQLAGQPQPQHSRTSLTGRCCRCAPRRSGRRHGRRRQALGRQGRAGHAGVPLPRPQRFHHCHPAAQGTAAAVYGMA